MDPTETDRQVAEMVAIVSATPQRSLGVEDVLRWAESVTDHAFYNRVAVHIAHRYRAGALGYRVCDTIMDDLWGVFIGNFETGALPSPFYEIYEAFDAGEYYRTQDRSDDPERDRTVPMIEKLLSERPSPGE